MAGTPTFIWIAPTATRPLPRDPATTERSVRTEPRAPNGLPKPPELEVTLVAQQRPPAKGAPGEPGWPACQSGPGARLPRRGVAKE